jgi:hypothetical protein
MYCIWSYYVVCLLGGTRFVTTSLISLPKDMGGVILNRVKKGVCKNLCSARNLVAKLFNAILPKISIPGAEVGARRTQKVICWHTFLSFVLSNLEAILYLVRGECVEMAAA